MSLLISNSGNDLDAPLIVNNPEDGYKGNEKMGIDEMLTKYCGEFGPWQRRHFILTCLAWGLEGLHTMVMIFADREPRWRYKGEVSTMSGSVCDLVPETWEWVGGLGASTVSEFGLVCGEKYKVGLVQAAFFGGCMVGAGVFGHLSDSYVGRKGSLKVVCLLNSIFGCLTALSPTYWLYTALRFITGFSTGGVGLCAFVLATEPVGPSMRGVAGMSVFYFFSMGIALLSAIAYMFQTWRVLYVVSSIPSILYLVMALPFITESPRWYLVRGKLDSAMSTMHEIAKRNGNYLPIEVVLALDDNKEPYDNHKIETKTEEAVTGSLVDVIKMPVTRVRLFLSVVINFMCAVVYYGISLNVVNLGTNLYLNVALNAFAEMPAMTLTAILLDKLGRKPLAIMTFSLSGIFCVLGSVVGNHGAWKIVRMICGILGIFGVAGTYNLLFLYTAELFPTVVRNAALGCATQASQMGAILAPFVVVLGGGLPFAVFGACGIVGGLFTLYLPETLNKPLYDTMAGMEDGERSITVVA